MDLNDADMISIKEVKKFGIAFEYFRSEQLYDSNLLTVNCGILTEFSNI